MGELTAIVGGNGSGKSNVLRALNLYFNGEVEADDALSLQRDVQAGGHQGWRSDEHPKDLVRWPRRTEPAA